MIKEIKCKHYKGNGYRYKVNSMYFLFCDKCNDKLLLQMTEQKKLENKLKIKTK